MKDLKDWSIDSMTDLLNAGCEQLDGHYLGAVNALAREFGEEELAGENLETELSVKISLFTCKIGAYVLDHAEAFPELLSEFQTEMDEIDTLVKQALDNQLEESEEGKEQD